MRETLANHSKLIFCKNCIVHCREVKMEGEFTKSLKDSLLLNCVKSYISSIIVNCDPRKVRVVIYDRRALITLLEKENTSLRGTMTDLLFILFGISCFAYRG